MAHITDEFMKQMLTTTRDYTAVILKEGPNYSMPDVMKIIWEHARRNFSLRADGLMPIVCPVTDQSGVKGISIFSTGIDETKKIMDEDPGVKEGVFVYEMHTVKSFGGDSLPK